MVKKFSFLGPVSKYHLRNNDIEIALDVDFFENDVFSMLHFSNKALSRASFDSLEASQTIKFES
jgi:hypothetical protein